MIRWWWWWWIIGSPRSSLPHGLGRRFPTFVFGQATIVWCDLISSRLVSSQLANCILQSLFFDTWGHGVSQSEGLASRCWKLDDAVSNSGPMRARVRTYVRSGAKMRASRMDRTPHLLLPFAPHGWPSRSPTVGHVLYVPITEKRTHARTQRKSNRTDVRLGRGREIDYVRHGLFATARDSRRSIAIASP
jgi:hypothetical protein